MWDSDEDISHVKNILRQKFEMKDMGELHYFLRNEVIRSSSGIWLFAEATCIDHVITIWYKGIQKIFKLHMAFKKS